MDPLVIDDYVIVYVHASLDQFPSFNWMKNAWTVFNRKYDTHCIVAYIIIGTRKI
jgi:hypothetical protein